jgi:hypothetical protein
MILRNRDFRSYWKFVQLDRRDCMWPLDRWDSGSATAASVAGWKRQEFCRHIHHKPNPILGQAKDPSGLLRSF